MLETLIKCSIISAKILKIYDELTDRYVRPTLNLFIRKPYGFGFSSLGYELESQGLAILINDFSPAGIVGSVKGGKIYMGSLANAGYKLVIFDEIMQLDNKAKKIVNELTEYGRATRDIQGFVEKRIEKPITGGKYVADSGKLILEVHCSFVFGTASDQFLQDPIVTQLLSRCFCLSVTMDKEEALMLKKYGRKIDVSKLKLPNEPINKVIISKELNEKLIEIMKEDATIVDEKEGGYFTRAHDDLIRLSAIHCLVRKTRANEIDKEIEVSKPDIKFALRFYPLHQLGFITSALSVKQMDVLQYCKGLTVNEIAKKVKLSDRQTYRHLNKLMELGLIVKVGNKYYNKYDLIEF